MAEPDSRYRIDMAVKYGQLKLIDIPRELLEHTPWCNIALTTVNDAIVRLGFFEGEFHFHKHSEQDELFLVLEGYILLDIEGQETVRLDRHQGYTVPRGVTHRPRAPQRAIVLMIEQLGVVPTGD